MDKEIDAEQKLDKAIDQLEDLVSEDCAIEYMIDKIEEIIKEAK
jgi:uncharacterized protein YfcZ (UPF0381/DUF406 family)